MFKFIRSHNYVFLIALYLLLVPAACSDKNGGDPDPTPDQPQIVDAQLNLITKSAVPGQMVLAQANFQPTRDTATIFVGTMKVLAMKADSNRIAFILPELSANAPAVIQYKGMGVTKQLSVTVDAYTPIAQPDPILADFITDLDKTINYYEAYEKSKLTPLDPAFGELLKYVKENLAIKIAALTPNQRKELAYIVQAYTLEPEESKMDPANPAFYLRTQATSNDPEAEFQENVRTLLKRVVVANKQISAGVLALAAGALTANPVVAFAGAVILIKGVKTMTDAQADSYSKSINSVMSRIEGTDVDQRIMIESLILEKGKTKGFVFKGSFRTLSKDDASSTVAAIKQFYQGKSILEQGFAAAKTAYGTLKNILGGSAPAFPGATPAVRESKGIKSVPMLASKLSITNISNPAIHLAISGQDTIVNITATSPTITEETPFTFDLVYTSTLTGAKITDKISAVYRIQEPASVAIVSGNNQVAAPGKKLLNPLKVVVKNTEGKVMPEIKVEWKVKSGVGTVSGAESLTDANGVAQVEWTLGASGTQEVEAFVKKSNGTLVTGVPLKFTASVNIDSTQIYAAAVVGNWTMTWNSAQNDGSGQIDKFTFYSDGTGIYYWMKCSGCPAGVPITPGNAVYRVKWTALKSWDGKWRLNITYPDRGWSSSTVLFLTPSTRCGVPEKDSSYFLGVKD